MQIILWAVNNPVTEIIAARFTFVKECTKETWILLLFCDDGNVRLSGVRPSPDGMDNRACSLINELHTKLVSKRIKWMGID